MNSVQDSCVIESRLWISRNIADYPFPSIMTKDLRQKLISELEHAFQAENIRKHYHLSWQSGKDVGYAEQLMLQVKYGFNHKRFEEKGYQMVQDPTENLMIFVGADDHLRIQKHQYGLSLDTLWDQVSALDDQLDNALEYAFDSTLGYLTSHVTDVGTGVHASVLMHLPALTETGYIEWVNQAANQLGLTVSGHYGRSNKGLGALYWIQNHVTLGRTEWEIIDTMAEVVRQITIKEEDALETLIVSKRLELEDQLYRSMGILQSARLMERDEMLEHLSRIRMGVRASVLKNISLEHLDELIFKTDTGVLQLESERILNALELKAQRADLCREFFIKGA